MNENGDNPLSARQLSLFGELLQADDPIDMWHGMPEFEQEDKMPLRTIRVHFFSELAVRKFARLLNVAVTEQTKYVYFPALTKESQIGLRYVANK
jgi:hypothetical protein